MKYFVSGSVDEAGLGAVVRAFGGEVTLTALPERQERRSRSTRCPPLDVTTERHPPAKAKRTVKRIAKGNGDLASQGQHL